MNRPTVLPSPHRAPSAPPILTRPAAAQLAVAWAALAATAIARPWLTGPLGPAALACALTIIVAVIVIAAFAVVGQAGHLARRLGEPYGTVILTLSISLVEVILISAVMLGPGEHATIARDSVMAVSMIILNLVIGLALLRAGLRARHNPARTHALRPNSAGTSAYLAMLLVLCLTAFGLPALIGHSGGYRPAQAATVIVLTVALYAFFLARQLGAQNEDFQEAGHPVPQGAVASAALVHAGAPSRAGAPAGDMAGMIPMAGCPAAPSPQAAAQSGPLATAAPPPVARALAQHRGEVIARTAVLVAAVIPIVLLSHEMAALLDAGLAAVGAPVALPGLIIAMIVFLPESLTTLRAARARQMQRVSNLCHGALVSTMGLTIPAVLAIGLITGKQVILAADPAGLTMLGVTLALSQVTFAGRQLRPVHGAAHLMLFTLYALTVFA